MKVTSYKKNLIIIIAVAVIVVLQSVYYVNKTITIRNNHQKVQDYINRTLSYEPDSLSNSALYINKWLESSYFSNEDKGRLYERASLIYMQLGLDMTYYRYLGYALYYLEHSSDKDYTVNIYLDLANFHLNNYAYDSAKEMLDKALSIESFEDIRDIQVKSYAFRMLAIRDIYLGNYDEAEKELLYSDEIVNLSNTGIYEDAYRAINDVYLSRVYIEQGHYLKAKEILDKYEGSGIFESKSYREIMLRDFIIPYYQNRCFIEVAMNYADGAKDTDAMIQTFDTAIENFVQLCNEEGYEKTAINTLLELEKKFPTDNEYIREIMYKKMYDLHSSLFDKQNSNYASIITSQVNDSKSAMEEQEKLSQANRRKTQLVVVSLLMFLVIISMGVSIILNSRYDALTQLFTRKAFNKRLERSLKTNEEIAIIMIDIDNFKNVNDTYGHLSGDAVLHRLGEIIGHEVKSDCKAYRYGGEEFTIMISKEAVKDCDVIAERIRHSMEIEKWDFDPNLTITISLGIAKGTCTSEVLKKADDNLYQAKHSGKNMVYSD